MKKVTLTLALFIAFIGTAQADYTVKSEDGRVTATIHTAGVVTGINENGEFQAQVVVTLREGNEMHRSIRAVTGCGKDRGGIAHVNQRTNSVLGEEIWLYNGDSMRDQIAAKACKVALEHMQIKAKEITGRTPNSTAAPGTKTP